MHMLGIMLHGVWKGAIGQHGDADVNDNGRLLLQMCWYNALCIMDPFFQHTDLHKYRTPSEEIRCVSGHSLTSA